MIKPCNYDFLQGKACRCAPTTSRLSFRGKVWLAYFACVALAIGTAIGMSILLAPGA